MPLPCELCRRDILEHVYTPEGSTRGLEFFLCPHCGLVQSGPRIDRTAERHPAAVSRGADWGNVRYGKGFRTDAALAAFARHADLAVELSVLDVGSNRGSFARAFLAAAPKAHLAAVEPDERFASSSAGLARTELVNARIEDVAFETGRFDAVHSCHTIEHLAHPLRTLNDHARTLKEGGLLVLDAPNIAVIGADDILEEWFIDKHLTHFSEATLARMIEAAGFTIIEHPDPADLVNLLFVAKRAGPARQFIAEDAAEADHARNLVARYIDLRARNLAALEAVNSELSALRPRRVAMWGAGRLFDSLVRDGGFDAGSLALLIDTHLKAHMEERHGRALSAPAELASVPVDVVVVMSRGFAGEIVAEARRLAPRAEIILYTDLIARARMRQAA